MSPRVRRRGSVALAVGREAGMGEPMEGGGKWEELETRTEATPGL